MRIAFLAAVVSAVLFSQAYEVRLPTVAFDVSPSVQYAQAR